MAEPRVELVRDGTKMGLWLGEVCLATVDAGPAAQQLARYVEMQLRAGFSPAAIQKMLRGESKQTTGSAAPPRRAAAPRPKDAPAQGPSEAKPAEDDALLQVVSGTVSDVKAALASGDYDDRLSELAALEKKGKNRKGVIAALLARERSR